MKIADLIQELQQLEKKHGNLEVTIMHCDSDDHEEVINKQSITFWDSDAEPLKGFHIWVD